MRCRDGLSRASQSGSVSRLRIFSSSQIPGPAASPDAFTHPSLCRSFNSSLRQRDLTPWLLRATLFLCSANWGSASGLLRYSSGNPWGKFCGRDGGFFSLFGILVWNLKSVAWTEFGASFCERRWTRFLCRNLLPASGCCVVVFFVVWWCDWSFLVHVEFDSVFGDENSEWSRVCVCWKWQGGWWCFFSSAFYSVVRELVKSYRRSEGCFCAIQHRMRFM